MKEPPKTSGAISERILKGVHLNISEEHMKESRERILEKEISRGIHEGIPKTFLEKSLQVTQKDSLKELWEESLKVQLIRKKYL